MLKYLILVPKNISIKLIIAKRVRSIAMPINALVILLLADSSAALSPPELIHCTAPNRKTKRKIIEPIISNIVIKAGSNR